MTYLYTVDVFNYRLNKHQTIIGLIQDKNEKAAEKRVNQILAKHTACGAGKINLSKINDDNPIVLDLE